MDGTPPNICHQVLSKYLKIVIIPRTGIYYLNKEILKMVIWIVITCKELSSRKLRSRKNVPTNIDISIKRISQIMSEQNE